MPLILIHVSSVGRRADGDTRSLAFSERNLPGSCALKIEDRQPLTDGAVEMQFESCPLTGASHRRVSIENVSDNSLQPASSPQSHQQFQKLRSQTFSLPRIRNQESEFSVVSGWVFEEAPYSENFPFVRCVENGNERQLLRAIDRTMTTQAFVQSSFAQGDRPEVAEMDAVIGKRLVEFYH